MIIFDFNQIIISNIMSQQGEYKQVGLSEDLLRHTILNQIRANLVKFKGEWGPEVVIACDDKRSWRKDIFPYYKANREKDRSSSSFDWTLIFETLKRMEGELRDHFPYIVLHIPGAEADDIIGVLVGHKCGCGLYSSLPEGILVISSDRDFRQLQVHPNVKQWSPLDKKFIVEEDPVAYLKEHIIRGDKRDGVPNILSSDSCLVMKQRQKSVTAPKLEEWLRDGVDLTDEVLGHRWRRNERMIDLQEIPHTISEAILQAYHQEKAVKKIKAGGDVWGYFMENNLKNLMGEIGDFL